MSISDDIKRLHELHQAGALSEAEFAAAKARLLAPVDPLKPSYHADPVREPSGDLVQEMSRLRRTRADRWLGGVCGGLAKASGMESWIWRLVFTLFALTFGFGAVIYLLLWIFVPEE